ncbi:MAG TPA: TIGR03000 domain-containing protein [Gemmataceae bacterium]|nr:TIGR03000 domain-containing protein [Gemmataceae bacterium]
MLGLHTSWLRASVLTLASLLLASGAAWAHGGGGGHGGGGHGGGIGHMGGFGHGYGGMHHGGIGYGGYHHGYGLYGVGFSGLRSAYPYYGLGFGLGYGLGMTYGGYGLGYGLGYPYYGYGYSFGGGYPYYGSYPYYNGYGSGTNYPYPYYNGLYNYSAFPYAAGANVYISPSSRAYYSPSNQQKPPKDDMAHLLVIVPKNAELWFNGAKTKQTGPQREFVSPTLKPGKHYSYEVKAHWTEDGKTMEQTRTAHVQANDWQTIDFTKPEASAGKKE